MSEFSPRGPQSVAAIILAAGSSSRMGRPKQLLNYQGTTLLRRVAEQAVAAGCAPVVLVTGHLHEPLLSEVHGLPIISAHNPDSALGMGSSLRVGLQALEQHAAYEQVSGVLVLLSDQPLVTTALLQSLVALHLASDAPAVATQYAGSIGVPAVFARSQWQTLTDLPPQQGAKKLLEHLGSAVQTIDFAPAALDIDTPEQYAELLARS
ncbi:nucleotidyltransferase family protein [Hymenobacter latericus]|uniref:nucleotidyltransferase family protein n=1 Tax=Hymenobacter sp. YIM 151858-1 TaxID=2987688 RepID=UPI002227B3DA|nr:nucleotidyltransferase family protein [Hymenobacter sp. YIM 151858-1]UYZ59823.1 nucleotidyltransferase family protein [Hymenobacter sp. YIM 151858-1]